MIQVKDDEKAKNDKFFKLNSYVKGSYDKNEDFKKLHEALNAKEVNGKGNRLFYLALPPSVYADVTSKLKEECMGPQ